MKMLMKSNALVVASFIFFACGETQTTANNTESATAEVELSTQEIETANESSSDYRYGIESGVVVYEAMVMGMKTTVTTYFAEHGEKETTVSKAVAKMMGMTIDTETKSITKDGYVYTIDVKEKTGTKMKMSEEFDMKNFDARSFEGEMKEQFEKALKESTTETFLGKSCKVLTLTDDNMKTSSKIWLWKNIPLKYIVTSAQGSMEVAATSVEEKAVPASMFEVPSDIEFKEVDPNALKKQMEMMQQFQGN